MSRRTARHAKPSCIQTAVLPAAVGGALLLGAFPAFAESSPSPSPESSDSTQPSPPAAGLNNAATAQLQHLVADYRTSLGLPDLTVDAGLTAQAVKHTREMAAVHRLYHADELFTRSEKQRLGMRLVGENVAYAGDTSAAHQALLDSPHHRDILQTSFYRRVGLAVVDDGRGAVYVTEDFGQPVPVAAAAPEQADRTSSTSYAARPPRFHEPAVTTSSAQAQVAAPLRPPAVVVAPLTATTERAALRFARPQTKPRVSAHPPATPLTARDSFHVDTISAQEQAKMVHHLAPVPEPAVLAARLRTVMVAATEFKPHRAASTPVRARVVSASVVTGPRRPQVTLPPLPVAAAAALLGLVAAGVAGSGQRARPAHARVASRSGTSDNTSGLRVPRYETSPRVPAVQP